MEHTSKEEEIVKDFRKSFHMYDMEDPRNVLVEECSGDIEDYILKIRREAIAERDEKIVKMLEDIIETANEEMGFHAKHNQIYWNGVRSKLEVLRRHLTQE